MNWEIQKFELITILVFLITCALKYLGIPGGDFLNLVLGLVSVAVLLLLSVKGYKVINSNVFLVIIDFFYKMHFVFAVIFFVNTYSGANIFRLSFAILAAIYIIFALIMNKNYKTIIVPLIYLTIYYLIYFFL